MGTDILGILPERPTIKVIDVGAMSLGADTDPYSALVKAGLARVVGFEPVQAECDKLNAMARAGQVYLPYAIGDGRKRTFNICSAPMTSSLYEPNTALLEKFQNLENLVRVVRREEIETHRLDDLREVEGADCLKLDVQGAEVDVLNGAAQTLAETLVVHTEVEFVPLYKDQPLFAEVDQRLRQEGFLFHKFTGISGRAFQPLVVNNDLDHPLSQMLWADAVYVKNFMALEKLRPEKLLKLAIILHLAYGSVDLAMQALRAYDMKMKTDLANTYLRGLTAPSSQPQ